MSATPSDAAGPAAAAAATGARAGLPGLDRCLVAAAAALVLCSLAPLAARWGWAFELTTHFRLQYLIAALVLGVALAARRRFLWCLPLLPAALISAAPLMPYLPTGQMLAVADEAPESAVVTAVTANLWIHNRAHERLLDLVDDVLPDLLLLPEHDFPWAAALEVLVDTYPHRIRAPRENDFGIALYSRHPLEEARAFDLLGRRAVEARVKAPQGTFRVVGVHLKAPTSPRRARLRNRQLEELAELRAGIDEPLLMLGDFNITPYSPYFTDFLAATGLRDAAAGRGPAITWPAFFPLLGIAIDHCLVSPELRVTEFRRLPRFGSDHYPVLTRFVLDITS